MPGERDHLRKSNGCKPITAPTRRKERQPWRGCRAGLDAVSANFGGQIHFVSNRYARQPVG
jgi:hypothetical protein